MFQQSDLGISGGRFTTAMLYLSTVEVFQIKLSAVEVCQIKLRNTNLKYKNTMRYCYTAVVCEQRSNVKKRCVLCCLNANKNAKIDTNIDKIEIRIQSHMQT